MIIAMLAAAAVHAHTPAKRVGPAIPASGDLSAYDLLQVMSLTARRDAFSVDPTMKYDGRPFAFYQNVKPDNDKEYGENNVRWTYDAPAKTLTFSLKGKSNFEFAYKHEAVGTYVGQNAFGVKTRVRASRDTSAGITVVNSDEIKLDTTKEIEPDQARSLVGRLRVRVEGVLHQQGGELVHCGNDRDGATLDDPTDVATLTCNAEGEITRVAVMDGSTVVAEWSQEHAHAAVQAEARAAAAAKASINSDVRIAGAFTPDESDMYYPDRAQRLGVSGSVTLDCVVAPSSVPRVPLTDCHVVRETPPDYDFASAAIRMSRLMRAEPAVVAGVPTAKHIVFPINFSPPR